MKVDKVFLKGYLNDSKDNKYILNLYKVYELCSKATGNDIFNNKEKLNILEDKIYTVNGQIISQENRILFETKKIINKTQNASLDVLKKCDILLKEISNKDINDESVQKSVKNKIVVLEAKLDLPINFLYDACLSFQDIYDSVYEKEIISNNNNFYKDLNIKNDYIKTKEVK